MLEPVTVIKISSTKNNCSPRSSCLRDMCHFYGRHYGLVHIKSESVLCVKCSRHVTLSSILDLPDLTRGVHGGYSLFWKTGDRVISFYLVLFLSISVWPTCFALLSSFMIRVVVFLTHTVNATDVRHTLQ